MSFPRLFLSSVVACTVLSSAVAAQSFVPTQDSQILEKLPVLDKRITKDLRKEQASLRESPDDLDLAISVARKFIGFGRAEGDPRYYGYAQAALAPWWSLAEPPVDILVLRAVLRQANHDFDGALDDLDWALERDPKYAQAWLTRAVILQVQGRYAEAIDNCAQLRGQVAPIITAACASGSRSLSGRAARGYRELAKALAEAPATDPQLKIWSLTILGEIAERQGNPTQSEKHFRDALSLDVRNTYLLGALADLLLDQQRYGEVRDLLKNETLADPLLLRLALAERGLGDKRAAEHREVLRSRFDASKRRGDSRHIRENARFTLYILEQPDEALRLALENWRTQHEPWDARLVLATAYAAGKPKAAKPILQWLEENKVEAAQIEPFIEQLSQDPSQ